MSSRVKRTYNLSPETVHRVRELAARYGVAETQDAVIEAAVERLYGERRDAEEAARWAAAAQDDELQAELAAWRANWGDDEWPR